MFSLSERSRLYTRLLSQWSIPQHQTTADTAVHLYLHASKQYMLEGAFPTCRDRRCRPRPCYAE